MAVISFEAAVYQNMSEFLIKTPSADCNEVLYSIEGACHQLIHWNAGYTLPMGSKCLSGLNLFN